MAILYAVSILAILSCLTAYFMGVRVLAEYQTQVMRISAKSLFSLKDFRNDYFVRQIWLINILNTICLIFVVLVFGDIYHIQRIEKIDSFFWWKCFDSFLAVGYALIFLDKLYDKRARL